MERRREGEGVFAELVPSFLTQLPRHGDLWWLGKRRNHRSCVPVPRIFCQSKDFPTLFRVSIDSAYFPMENLPRDRNYIFLRGSLVKIFVSQHSKFYENIQVSKAVIENV